MIRIAATLFLPFVWIRLTFEQSWRDGRVAEGDGLLNRYTGSNPYPGFESPSLRFLASRKRFFRIGRRVVCQSGSASDTSLILETINISVASEARAAWR